MKILAIALVLISFPVFANELKVENYVKMQEALDQPGLSIPLSRLVSHGKLLPIWSNSFRNRGPVT